jgi:glucose-1-phosphate cytidylyltransferase
MKVVILAGGFGTRISEESIKRPKPLIEIGGKPILWHLMKFFSSYGFKDFIICCGYKADLIKLYFKNFNLMNNDFTINLKTNEIKYHTKINENWNVTLVDTGINTQTGGRLKRIKDFLKKDENFFFTYGDGLSDVNLNELLSFHNKKKVYATVTAVKPPGRFGVVEFNIDKIVKKFDEKPKSGETFINGGFFILNKACLDFVKNDDTKWEEEPLRKLSKKNKLAAYIHKGFWRPMDTIRDKDQLENLWNSNLAPWKIWR